MMQVFDALGSGSDGMDNISLVSKGDFNESWLDVVVVVVVAVVVIVVVMVVMVVVTLVVVFVFAVVVLLEEGKSIESTDTMGIGGGGWVTVEVVNVGVGMLIVRRAVVSVVGGMKSGGSSEIVNEEVDEGERGESKGS